MKIMLETTKWEDGAGANHIYVFEKYHPTDRSAKVIAYSPFGTNPVQKFKKAMMIDLKGRTFQTVD